LSKVTGQVYKLFDKNFRGKTLWSFRLENDPIYYRMDENRGAGIVEPGNYIEFDANLNSDGKSAQVTGPPTKVVPASPVAGGAVATPGRGGNYADRESSIHYQSARKDALVFVGMAVSAGAIVLPAKTSAKLAALEALVDAYTAQYLEDISTGGAVTRAVQRAYDEDTKETEERVPKPGKKQKAAPPPEADDDDEYGDDDE
jgi:hypothetical protein